MTNAIRVLEPGASSCCLNLFTPFDVRLDGTERQIIKDMDGNMPRARIKTCSICDPFVLILREDETIGLFIGETERGKIRRKDMSPMGEKASLTSPRVMHRISMMFRTSRLDISQDVSTQTYRAFSK